LGWGDVFQEGGLPPISIYVDYADGPYANYINTYPTVEDVFLEVLGGIEDGWEMAELDNDDRKPFMEFVIAHLDPDQVDKERIATDVINGDLYFSEVRAELKGKIT
jgi:hypothetical protein